MILNFCWFRNTQHHQHCRIVEDFFYLVKFLYALMNKNSVIWPSLFPVSTSSFSLLRCSLLLSTWALFGLCPFRYQILVDLRWHCKTHASCAFRAGHDVIQDTLARELRLLDLKVVNNDQELRENCSLFTSKKRGYTAISAPAEPSLLRLILWRRMIMLTTFIALIWLRLISLAWSYTVAAVTVVLQSGLAARVRREGATHLLKPASILWTRCLFPRN